MGLKYLVVARHGDYTAGHLDEDGQRDIRRLAEELKELIPEGGVILSSTAARAVESAEIISEVLGSPFTTHEVLWSEPSRPEDLPAALELVRTNSDGADVVILVTHYEYAELFPEYFSAEELEGINFPAREIEKGQAWIIDCEQRTCNLIN